MPLSVGDKLGPYEILAPIGAGGMGEVYKARDTRLNRDVAIKVSKEEFNERFTREARSIAALNHTNVCHLYDIGPNYLVMEYVEGEIIKGPLPLEEAMPIILQLVDGIEAAHERNVVHRDLKPANIKITPEGMVKILDFGLARAADPAPEGCVENSPTLTMGATQAGTILGTAAYMSPEQAKGKTADRRSDIWSFGVVVYELLTGKRPFDGETVVETLGAVLNKEPDWTPVPERTRRLLQRCLKKDRKQRLGAIVDARWVMEEYRGQPESQARGLRYPPWSVAIVAVLAAVGILFAYFHHPEPGAPVLNLAVNPPEKSTFGYQFSLSPDGRMLAFSTGEGRSELWIRHLDSATSQLVAETESVQYPFWSPDSRSVAFFSQQKLKRIEVSGGPARTICETGGPIIQGGDWNRDGVIIFAPGTGGLQRVSATGGLPEPVTRLEDTPGAINHNLPIFLPDGRRFLYHAGGAGVFVGSLDGQSKDRKVLLNVPSKVAYSSGYLLFVRDGTLLAQRFDPDRVALLGDPRPVAENVALSITGGAFMFSVSSGGLLAYRTGGEVSHQLAWFDREGRQLEKVGEAGPWLGPVLSPDGIRVAAIRGSDLWVLDLARGASSRLAQGGPGYAIWSPDGSRVAYSSHDGIHLRIANGSGDDELLVSGVGIRPRSWSHDGKFLAYNQTDSKTKQDLWLLSPTGDRKPVIFLRTPFNETEPAFSPDGRFLAYTSDESGTWQIYVQTVPRSANRWQVSTASGLQPSWRQDGKEMFFVSNERKLMAVDVKTNAGFEAGVPHELFALHFDNVPELYYVYTPGADGKRFLVANVADETTFSPIQIVSNWLELVRK